LVKKLINRYQSPTEFHATTDEPINRHSLCGTVGYSLVIRAGEWSGVAGAAGENSVVLKDQPVTATAWGDISPVSSGIFRLAITADLPDLQDQKWRKMDADGSLGEVLRSGSSYRSRSRRWSSTLSRPERPASRSRSLRS
jgi:hypothetical protein